MSGEDRGAQGAEPLREPEPERPTGSDLERRVRERERRMPWVRIAIMVAALVGLLVFHQSISSEMAGCFQRNYVAEDRAKAAPSEPGQVRIEPARRLPADDTSR